MRDRPPQLAVNDRLNAAIEAGFGKDDGGICPRWPASTGPSIA
jgi:hypothetical protein